MFVQGRLRGCVVVTIVLLASACSAQTSTWSNSAPATTELSTQLDSAIHRLSQRPTSGPRFGEPTPADPPKNRVPFDNFNFLPQPTSEKEAAPHATHSPTPGTFPGPQSGSPSAPNTLSSDVSIGAGGYPIIDSSDNSADGPILEIAGPQFVDEVIVCGPGCQRCGGRGCRRRLRRGPLRRLGCRLTSRAAPRLLGNHLCGHPWCGRSVCHTCCRRGGLYGGYEYLYWWSRGMNVPTLATTSPLGVGPANAGLKGLPTTTNLFGPGRLDADGHSGGRFRLGFWLDPCRCRGIEADYFLLEESSYSYYARAPEDHAILARPYYDTDNGAERAQLVGYPGVVDGTLIARGTTDFQGGGLLYRKNLLCCSACGGCDPCNPCSCGTRRGWGWLNGACDWLNSHVGCYLPCGGLRPTRVDGLVGWRAYKLDESLDLQESLTYTDPAGVYPVGTTANISDSFGTKNTFNGLVLGTDAEWCRGRWGLGSRLRVSLGNLQRQSSIAGETIVDTGAGPTTYTGGVMALPSNIGSYSSDDQFIAVPEVGVSWFYCLRRNVRFNFGYNFLYLADVWRPGDVIDVNIDPRQIPPPTVATAASPQFAPRSDDFWAQGINLGIDFRY